MPVGIIERSETMVPDFEMIYLCEHCIGAIRSRGEKVFVGEMLSDFELDEGSKCEWCEEEKTELYECHF